MNESPFDIYAEKYDMWYEEHYAVYESELEAIRELLPEVIPEKSLEIGAGTGRFASALGISYGLDPFRKDVKDRRKTWRRPCQGSCRIPASEKLVHRTCAHSHITLLYGYGKDTQ